MLSRSDTQARLAELYFSVHFKLFGSLGFSFFCETPIKWPRFKLLPAASQSLKQAPGSCSLFNRAIKARDTSTRQIQAHPG